MADLSYFHGVKLEESPDTPSVLRLKNYGVTFLNGHADDADDTAFPLDEPKLITSLSQASALGAAGSLRRDLTTILQEGGSYVVVNRVAYSAVPATMLANLIGDPVARTGLYAFHRVKGLLGVKPRVIVTDGETGEWIEGGLVSTVLATAGANLTEAPSVTATGGGNAAGKVLPTLEVVMGTGPDAGKVVSLKILTPGKGMTEPPTLVFADGGDDEDKVLPTATANIGDVGNAIVSALKTIVHADGARARAYVHGPNTDNAAAVRFRNSINSDRILVIDPKGIRNVDGVPVTVPSAPVFAGVRARVVASAEGVAGSVSNKMIRTLDGVARTINYPLDSNYLNEHQVNTIINERGGLRTWGSRLAAENILWQFDSVRATADMINEDLEDLYFLYVDRKFTRGNLKMLVEDGNAALRVRALNDDILGGRVWLSDLNVPTLNAQGKVFLNVEFEPVGLMEQIHVTTHRNILYYQLLLDDVRGAIENGPLSLAA